MHDFIITSQVNLGSFITETWFFELIIMRWPAIFHFNGKPSKKVHWDLFFACFLFIILSISCFK